MTFAFYFDENVSDEVADGAVSAGLDVVTARQDNHAGDPDENILGRSVVLDRVLVTRDVDFFAIADVAVAEDFHYEVVRLPLLSPL